jgi:hypothetical protein
MAEQLAELLRSADVAGRAGRNQREAIDAILNRKR